MVGSSASTKRKATDKAPPKTKASKTDAAAAPGGDHPDDSDEDSEDDDDDDDDDDVNDNGAAAAAAGDNDKDDLRSAGSRANEHQRAAQFLLMSEKTKRIKHAFEETSMSIDTYFRDHARERPPEHILDQFDKDPRAMKVRFRRNSQH
jgi:hypothetical protein